VGSRDIDIVALMAGVGFVGIAAIALLSQDGDLAARWKWPLLLILMGVVGLAASRRGARR
jgi:multidrug transporter EmrE-like cation transporter